MRLPVARRGCAFSLDLDALTMSETVVGRNQTGFASVSFSLKALIVLLTVVTLGFWIHGELRRRNAFAAKECVHLLRTIDAIKQQWALETDQADGAEPPTWDTMYSYIKANTPWAKCPRGGTYVIGRIGELPVCSVPAHQRAFEDSIIEPIVYPPGTPVTLNVAGSTFALGPNSRQRFLAMLSSQPTRSEISAVLTEPIGVFTVHRARYLWHGNAVILREGRVERLWHGNYLQRLSAALTREIGSRTDCIQPILDAFERNPAIADLEEPDESAANRDAVHPARRGDLHGGLVPGPETNQP